MSNEHNKSSFSGSLGFVLAAAGSAVGLGNIWRFPYLAAKGKGLFLVVYIVLALTFGFTLLTTEIAIGRKNRQSPLKAYKSVNKNFGFVGVLACLVPMIILPYYCAIGGWVIKYFVTFLFGKGIEASEDEYFGNFISSVGEPIVYMIIFLAMIMFIVYRGVNKGIESSSKIIMPILLVLVIIIAVYSLTLTHTDRVTGVTRTGLEGLKVYVVPDLDGITIKDFFGVVVDAMGQLFFSLSVAMGILVAYGSYVKDDANLVSSINQIELFDTVVAFLAGVMIIPAVFTFMGMEGMNASGPGLMFASLPKVFASMGKAGNIVGILFFAMVLFAAVTSAVSVLEAIVACIMEGTKTSRTKATITEGLIALVFGVIVCLGFNKLSISIKLPNGSDAGILDIMDYISNSALMPIVAILTCILIGWVVKPKYIIDEVEKTGHKFGRRRLFIVMIKFIAPIFLLILLLMSLGILTII